MTEEEKLKLFLDVVMKDAKKQNMKVVNSYKEELERSYEEYKESVMRKAELQVKTGKESLVKKKNSETAKKQVELRREYGIKQDTIVNRLFDEVMNKLLAYKDTDDYVIYMNKCIKKAENFAKGEMVTVYIDRTDDNLKKSLVCSDNMEIVVSDENIIGGVRAVIPSKNVLIDESFSSKLEEERHTFIL